jgi:hypothetical protein
MNGNFSYINNNKNLIIFKTYKIEEFIYNLTKEINSIILNNFNSYTTTHLQNIIEMNNTLYNNLYNNIYKNQNNV